MTGSEWGWIGGITGAVIGTLGGAVGTWASIRNARPGPPRRFMIRAALAMWLLLALMMVLVILSVAGVLPHWVTWTTQTVFFVALGPVIFLGNRHLAALEVAEDTADPDCGGDPPAV
jgi:hypothetical protein